MQRILNIFEKALFWLVIFLFAFIPLYPKFPLINIKGTFVAIRIEDLIVALAIVLWILLITLSKGLKGFYESSLNQAVLFFFFVGLLSLFCAIFLTHTVIPSLSFLHWLRRVEYMLPMFVVATAIKNKRQLISILAVFSTTLLIVNIYALGQQYLDWPVISTSNSEFSKGLILQLTPDARVNSTFAGHYDLATFLAMALIGISSLFFYFRKILIKVWILILAALSLVVLMMTAARLSFVAAFLGAILTLLMTGKKKFILFTIIAALLILIYPSQLRDRFISTITVNIFNRGQRYIGQTQDQKIRSQLNIPTLAIKTSSKSATTSSFASGSATASDITPGEPIDTTQLGVYRSFEIRLNIEWPRAVNAFLKNPFLGTGYSSLGLATDNDLLRSLGEVGILGTVAFVLVLTALVKSLIKPLSEGDRFIKYFSAATLSIIFAFLLNSLFIDVFEASKVATLFWMFLGLSLASLKFR